MSKLLYKLGSFAAHKAWVVVTIWALILAGLGGSYAAFKGEMSSNITIPGTEAQQLQETLSEKFDANASAGTGQIILENKDGSEFTEEQKQAVADAVSSVEGVDQVDSALNPFATAQEINDGQKQLDDAQGQLDEGKKKIDDAQAQLDETQQKIDDGTLEQEAQEKIDAGQAKLDDARQQVEDGEAQAAAAEEQLNTGQVELDAKRTELEDAQAQLDTAQSELDSQREAAQAAGSDATSEINAAQTELNNQREQLNSGFAQLKQGQEKIDSGRKELEANKPKLEEGRQKYEDGQTQLNEQRTKLEDGTLIAEAQKKVDDGQAEVDKNRKELETNQAEVTQNKALLEMSADASSISDDGSAAIVTVTFTDEAAAITPENLEAAREKFSSLEDKNMTVLFDQYMEGQQSEMGMTGEIIGIIIAFIILFVMLGTLMAAGLPIIMAVTGLGAAMLGTLALSGVVEMTSTTPALGSMLGLAVGIDYTLFILNRHRNNLAQGMDIKKSIALATGTSGGAVVFAGTTVMIALLALNVVGIPFLSVMGNAAAFAVFMAVAVSVTLSPAILSLIGRRIISKKRWATIEHRNAVASVDDPELAEQAHVAAVDRETRAGAWLKTALAQPVITILVSIAVLGIIASPMTSMRLGLPDGSSQSADSAAYKTYMSIEENFGAGQNGTVIAAATLPEGTTEEQAKELQVEVGQDLLKQNDVEKVIPAMISKDNDMLLYQIVPREGPSAVSTENLVNNLRDHKADTSYGEVTFGVTGQTAMNIDISKNLFEVLPIYIAIVLGLSLIVLVLVFRSLWVPITATVGFLFSLAAAFGATTAVFQWGWLGSLFGVTTPGPLLSFMPILAVGILFGLAMDYQVFLVSAMREAYSHGRTGKDSVIVGFNHSSRVVVAAALIMTGVFVGFVFSGEPMIASIGFVLAAGVLFDAFVVRMTLIPALMYLLGERAWKLPGWLDKILPDLDVEGAKLEEDLKERKSSGKHGPVLDEVETAP